MIEAPLLPLFVYSSKPVDGDYSTDSFRETFHCVDPFLSESEKAWFLCNELVCLKQWEQAKNALSVYHELSGRFDIQLHTRILAAIFSEQEALDTPWSDAYSNQFYSLFDNFLNWLSQQQNDDYDVNHSHQHDNDDSSSSFSSLASSSLSSSCSRSQEILSELCDVVILYTNRCIGHSESPCTIAKLRAAHDAWIKFFSIAYSSEDFLVESWIHNQEEAFDCIAQHLIQLGEMDEAERVLREASCVSKDRSSVFLAMRAEIAEARGNVTLAHELYKKLGDTTISSFYDDYGPNWMGGLDTMCPLGSWPERVHRTSPLQHGQIDRVETLV